MTAAGKTPVAWNFSTMPSENWKNGVGSALTAYAAGTAAGMMSSPLSSMAGHLRLL